MSRLNNSLQEFSQRRTSLLDLGNSLQKFLSDSGQTDRAREVSGHLMRLEADSVKVAVIGEFKAGKSTLINSILGKEILPCWTVECTAAITQVGYGDEPAMIVHTSKGKQEQYPLEQLKELATTKNDNFDEIAYIEAQYPTDLLKNGLIIVDTPGANSAVKARELITKRFMRIADAAILVLNIEYLLKQSEVQFIRDEINQRNYGAVFVVVNRCDLYRDQPDQLKNALDKASIKLKELIPSLERIYPVSALNALDGRESGDNELVATSGIEELESDLAKYVTERGVHDRLEKVKGAFADILAEYGNDCRMSLSGLTLDKEKADVYARKATESLKREGERLDELKNYIHEGFREFRTRLADDVRRQSNESRANLQNLYGGTHSDPPQPEVIAERIKRDSGGWLSHAEQQWQGFHNDMMVWTSNYLSGIERELSDGLATESGQSLMQVKISPVRVEVQSNIREHTEYVEEYQTRKVQRSSGSNNVSGLGIGMMLGGLILGGWLGVGLAIFGGASLFGGGGDSWDDEELEKIRKPVTKQIKEFTVSSLEEPYRKLTDEMLSHLDKVLNTALKGLLDQVEKIARNHHGTLRNKMSDIERQRTGSEGPKEVARLQAILVNIDELTGKVRGSL